MTFCTSTRAEHLSGPKIAVVRRAPITAIMAGDARVPVPIVGLLRTTLGLRTSRDMVAHMKTTIDIADSLLVEAKRVAVEQGTTLRELVEQGLRGVIERRRQRVGFRLRDASFAGDGLRREVADGSWQRVRDLAYDGRGA